MLEELKGSLEILSKELSELYGVKETYQSVDEDSKLHITSGHEGNSNKVVLG